MFQCLQTYIMHSSGLTALVFGASGITGWAIPSEALRDPTPKTFKRVIALTNRPLSKKDAYFPEDDRLQITSGVDLTKGPAAVLKALEKIEGIREVTHVYFAGESVVFLHMVHPVYGTRLFIHLRKLVW